MFIPFNWIIPLLWIYLKKIILDIEKIHKDVYCGIFYDCKELETTLETR